MLVEVITWVNEPKEMSLSDMEDLILQLQSARHFEVMRLETVLGDTIVVYVGDNVTDEELVDYIKEAATSE